MDPELNAPERVETTRSHGRLIAAVIVMIVGLLIYTQLTIFVVSPIGALPEGKAVVMLRGQKMAFIDSADALCERTQGGVSLMCRGLALGAIGKNATILMRLPYSSFLYSISTGGKTYDR